MYAYASVPARVNVRASERAGERARAHARVASAGDIWCMCVCVYVWLSVRVYLDACNVDSYTISINVHKNNTATRLRAGRVRAESRTEH